MNHIFYHTNLSTSPFSILGMHLFNSSPIKIYPTGSSDVSTQNCHNHSKKILSSLNELMHSVILSPNQYESFSLIDLSNLINVFV